MAQKNYSVDSLTEITSRIFKAYGLSDSCADISAKVIVKAEISGLKSHGFDVLTNHLKRLENGQYNRQPMLKTVRENEAFMTLDGDNAIGYFAAFKGMDIAVEKALCKGLYVVFSHNNNTYGPGFYYVQRAAEKGLISIALSNSPAAMAPWNGKDKLMGTNPFSMGVPIKGEDPILFDMSSSKVAKSKLRAYASSRQKIPEDWALNEIGEPTTDPNEAIKGLMLPMAGHKGYGIAMMIDIMAGVLSESAFLSDVGRFYSDSQEGMNVGFCFVAINPEIVMGKSYDEKIRDYRDAILSCKPINENVKVRLPGAEKIKNQKKAMLEGVLLESRVIDVIRNVLEVKGLNIKL